MNRTLSILAALVVAIPCALLSAAEPEIADDDIPVRGPDGTSLPRELRLFQQFMIKHGVDAGISYGSVYDLWFRQAALDDVEVLAAVKNFPDVQSVWFSDPKNTYDGNVLRCLKGLKNLKWLNFDKKMPIRDDDLKNIADLTTIECMNLECPTITDDGLKHLAGIKNLKLIRLNGAKITDAGLRHLAGLPLLQHLELGETGVTDKGLEVLAGMPNMQVVHLNKTKITDVGMLELSKVKKLWALDVSNTAITDAGLARLAPLQNLHWVSTVGCNVSKEAIEELNKRLR